MNSTFVNNDGNGLGDVFSLLNKANRLMNRVKTGARSRHSGAAPVFMPEPPTPRIAIENDNQARIRQTLGPTNTNNSATEEAAKSKPAKSNEALAIFDTAKEHKWLTAGLVIAGLGAAVWYFKPDDNKRVMSNE